MLVPDQSASVTDVLLESRPDSLDPDSSIVEGQIRRSYARFCELLSLAEEKFAAKDLPAASALCHIAARCAYPGNVGLFGSYRLEKLLLAIGGDLPTSSDGPGREKGGAKLNVLHVLSYGRPIGGDSRFVWRWIQADKVNRHSVVITTQADLSSTHKVPDIIKSAAEATGGFLRMLKAPVSKPLDQANELRRLCQEMDLVVLHLFPYDIVPVLALAAGCDSVRTLFVDHSDHTFWVGGSVAHAVVHLRKQSREFLTLRRGLNPDRCSILPIPLPVPPPSSASSAGVKESLGLKPDDVLLLTIASPFKYSSPNQLSFLELVTPVIAKHPSAHLVAVGPDPNDVLWRDAKAMTQGRIIARGAQWDNNDLYAAADIYLDSVPFSSITSLLEAGSRGVPLLGYRSNNPELNLLSPGAPGLDESMLIANDSESYKRMLGDLISCSENRCGAGAIARDRIEAHHCGEGWRRQLSLLYRRTDPEESRGCIVKSDPKSEATALNLALVRLYPQISTRRLIAKYVGPLPYMDRISISWRLSRSGFGLCLLNLLPPRVDAVGRAIWHRIRGRIGNTVTRYPLLRKFQAG
jgi:hypothetical protein